MKALFFYPNHSPFIQVDEDILMSIMPVHSICLHQSKGKWTYLLHLWSIVTKILRHSSAKLCLCWFADYHAFVMVLAAKVFQRKAVIFIGGYDAVHYHEYAYGVYHHALRRFCAIYALKHCDLIIANHEALLSSNNYYYNSSGHPEGVFKLIPELKTRAVTVYNSITGSAPSTINLVRQQQILSVGSTPRLEDFYNKGYDLLIDAAKAFPCWQFIIVGIQDRWRDTLEPRHKLSAVPNLRIHAKMEHSEVLRLMSESDIYVQVSISEGMPNALMEAMLYGCKALGSDVAGIPTIIGEYGHIIRERSTKALIEGLKILMDKEVDRVTLSKDISTRFSNQNRMDGIQRALRDVL
ncbi:MAG: glycosyltransferase family 4 protein [Candidatus Cloacimonetes bacterium]|nr:glycosyltransferase family 4 protein [Candidatus Cloacimonadota bacterium]MDD2506330.1 glycosyltransferase family 4 protein [Candidatus Cloacimonadota bacterium]MDD4147370.1 glycosyltransferase family 4 protein [Candidatus Cloacimonadota bacterium]